MTGVMVLFAFAMSLVINLVERKFNQEDEGLFSEKQQIKDSEGVWP